MARGDLPRLGAEARALLRRAAALDPEACLVGGAIRDALLDRPTRDLDLVSTQARVLARALSRQLDASFVVLDERTQVFRVALGAGFKTVRQIDVAARQGTTIEEDLARRDFTINALAMPLRDGKPAGLLDPRGGLRDLRRKVVRTETPKPFEEDPLRLLRGWRIAAELDFSLEPRTARMMTRLRQRVRRPAAERIQAELMALLAVPGCSRWLRAMDEARLLTALFEDLEPARQCALVYYGPGGVLTHSLETAARADFLLQNLARVLPREAAGIEERLTRRAAAGASAKAVLILAALLHDVSKPETARRMGGRLRFFGHDQKGARRAESILKALKFPRQTIDSVSAVISHHLRPGNLAAGGPVTDKAAYRFFRDLGEHALDLLLVCWADHASYLPESRLFKLLEACRAEPGDPRAEDAGLSRVQPPSARKTVHHLRVVSHLLRRLLDSDRRPVPERLLDGFEVMKALKLPPGPQVGAWLERLREAQAEGKVLNRQDALEFIRRAQ